MIVAEAAAAPAESAAPWIKSWRADPYVKAILDRHYNRQNPNSAQFVPPGACLVLKTVGAAWVSSWPKAEWVKHAWAGAWMNTAFRNERQDLHLSSELIRAGVSATRWYWPDVPDLGMVSFVDADKTEAKDKPGWCYRKAGFKHVGFTQSGLWAFQMLPEDMPVADAPAGVQHSMFEEAMA